MPMVLAAANTLISVELKFLSKIRKESKDPMRPLVLPSLVPRAQLVPDPPAAPRFVENVRADPFIDTVKDEELDLLPPLNVKAKCVQTPTNPAKDGIVKPS